MKRLLNRTLPLLATAGFLLAESTPAQASSHMDAPLITLDDAANTTDVYTFVREESGEKSLVTALGVYPFEEPGIGPNKFNFDDNVLYEIHVATGPDVAAGCPTFSYQFRFDTRFKNTKTILQSYLGVIKDVDDAAQNLTQFYTVTKVDHRTGRRTVLGRGVVPPNNQGNATPFYNQGDNGENPAKDGVATFAELDRYTKQSIASLDRGYVAFAGQRDDGFYGDIQAIFDLLTLRSPGKDAQGGFNLHLMALAIPVDELGGDRQLAGVYATTSRRRFTILADGLAKSQQFGDWVQVARQGNPLFNEGLVAIEDKDLYSRTTPSSDARLFRKYAERPELAKLLNLLVLEPDIAGIETGRTDIAGIFIPDVIKVDLSTRSARLAGGGPMHPTNPDDPGFSRLGIFGGDVLISQNPTRLRRRCGSRRLAQRPAVRRRRRRHRGDGAHQRSADDAADRARARRRQRRRQRHGVQQGVPVRVDAAERAAAPTPLTVFACFPCYRRAAALSAAALCLFHPAAAFAHDPGLSSLDVRVLPRRIIAVLSVSAADVKTTGGRVVDVEALARDAIELHIDDVRLRASESRSMDGETEFTIHLTFERAPGSRLTIRSEIPSRLAPGHRQLLTIQADGRLLADRMLSAEPQDVVVDLDGSTRARPVLQLRHRMALVCSALIVLAAGIYCAARGRRAKGA